MGCVSVVKLFEVFLPMETDGSARKRVEVRAHDTFDALRRAIEQTSSPLNMSSMDCDFGNDGSMTATDFVSGRQFEIRLYIPPPQKSKIDDLSQTMDITAFPELEELHQLLAESGEDPNDLTIPSVQAVEEPKSKPLPPIPPLPNSNLFVAPPPPPPPPPALPGEAGYTKNTDPSLDASTLQDGNSIPALSAPKTLEQVAVEDPLRARPGKLPDVNATMLLEKFGEEPNVKERVPLEKAHPGVGKPNFGGKGIPMPSTPPPPSKPSKK